MIIWKMKWQRNSAVLERDAELYRCYIYGATDNGKKERTQLTTISLFIDYEKAYDNVNRDKLWEMMDNKIPNYLLNTTKCI